MLPLDEEFKLAFAMLERDADQHLDSLLEHAEQIAGSLDGGSPTQAVLKHLIGEYRRLARGFYGAYKTRLKEEAGPAAGVGQGLFRAIEKLSDEWENLSQVLPAALMAQARVNALVPVVQTAMRDVDLLYNQVAVLPQFGRQFSLVSFKYAPGVAILGIPVFNLYTPWEWGVIWHEMAGHKVRVMKQKAPQVFEALRPPEGGATWSADWMEELFEDACGVRAFEPGAQRFIGIFDRVLSRYNPDGDARHPPKKVRLRMALLIAGEALDDRLPEEKEARDRIVQVLPPQPEADDPAREAIRQAMSDYLKGNNPNAIRTATWEKLGQIRARDAERVGAAAETEPSIASLMNGDDVPALGTAALLELPLSETDFVTVSGHHTNKHPANSDPEIEVTFSAHGQTHRLRHRKANHG
jgi:hypothetical protein